MASWNFLNDNADHNKNQKKKKRFIAKNRYPDILEVCLLEPLNLRLFHRHCGSTKAVPLKVQELLKLDMSQVKARPHFKESAFDLFRWVESTTDDGMVIFMAHNGDKFDHKILRYHLQERGLTIPPNWYFADTLPLARSLLPGLRSYSIKNLALGLLGKEPVGLHQASEDVAVLWAILRKLVKEENEKKALSMIARHQLSTLFGIQHEEISEDLEESDFNVLEEKERE